MDVKGYAWELLPANPKNPLKVFLAHDTCTWPTKNKTRQMYMFVQDLPAKVQDRIRVILVNKYRCIRFYKECTGTREKLRTIVAKPRFSTVWMDGDERREGMVSRQLMYAMYDCTYQDEIKNGKSSTC